MGLNYFHLDDEYVRGTMKTLWLNEASELAELWTRDACYGKDLTDAGWDVYLKAMPKALESHDDEWLRETMNNPLFWNDTQMRQGKPIRYNVDDALRRLTYGEFNIAYVRGLATVLQERSEEFCTVYRADAAYQPRAECSSWEGMQIPVTKVLAGHRVRYFPPPGDNTAFMLPSGPHCHHSIRGLSASRM